MVTIIIYPILLLFLQLESSFCLCMNTIVCKCTIVLLSIMLESSIVFVCIIRSGLGWVYPQKNYWCILS